MMHHKKNPDFRFYSPTQEKNSPQEKSFSQLWSSLFPPTQCDNNDYIPTMTSRNIINISNNDRSRNCIRNVSFDDESPERRTNPVPYQLKLDTYQADV